MKPSSLLLSTSKNRYSHKNQIRSADNIQSSGRDHPRSGQPNNMVMGKETFSSSAFQMMLSSATRKGQVTCIGLKRKKSKSRQTRSSFAFFDLNNKNLVPYNIKSFLRNSVSPYDVRSFGQSVSADCLADHQRCSSKD